MPEKSSSSSPSIPPPVSLTEKSKCALPPSAFPKTESVTLPLAVNFAALKSRSFRIWRSLSSSPRRASGIAGETLTFIARSFSRISGMAAFVTSETNVLRE